MVSTNSIGLFVSSEPQLACHLALLGPAGALPEAQHRPGQELTVVVQLILQPGLETLATLHPPLHAVQLIFSAWTGASPWAWLAQLARLVMLLAPGRALAVPARATSRLRLDPCEVHASCCPGALTQGHRQLSWLEPAAQ